MLLMLGIGLPLWAGVWPVFVFFFRVVGPSLSVYSLPELAGEEYSS